MYAIRSYYALCAEATSLSSGIFTMIALIAAVPLETEFLRRELSPWEVVHCGGYDLFLCSLRGRQVGLLHCGVGKVNAAAATATLISTRKPEMVLSFGCGGAYPSAPLGIGDLALATSEIYGDEGVLSPEGFRNNFV